MIYASSTHALQDYLVMTFGSPRSCAQTDRQTDRRTLRQTDRRGVNVSIDIFFTVQKMLISRLTVDMQSIFEFEYFFWGGCDFHFRNLVREAYSILPLFGTLCFRLLLVRVQHSTTSN